MWPNPQETAESVRFTEEMLDGLLCVDFTDMHIKCS